MENRVCIQADAEEGQKMKDNVKPCRKCGRPVCVITWGVYRSVLVDAQAVMVAANPEGEEFVRLDGSKVLGWEADYEEQ